ncbi:Translation initiation factor eif-2b subunit alpha, partial [Globisporangium splendens]
MTATTKLPVVVQDFLQYLSDADVAVAVAVIKALTGVIVRSEASTMMQMESELQEAAHQLKTYQTDDSSSSRYQNSIATTAGCQLFLRYVTRCFLEFDDFELCKSQLIDRGNFFAETSLSSRKRIAEVGHSFIRDGMRVLTHGASRVVIALLCEAAKTKHFSVFITEGRGNGSGLQTAEKLAETGIPTTMILDSAVGFYMEQSDMVIVGAEGVVENGGIVNSVGTYSAAVIAQALKKPFYVAAESYKFARLYPLTQRDVPQTQMELPVSGSLAKNEAALANISLKNPFFDYTPPGYISLMFTDLGVLTPSAVSDELIKLYQ